MPRVISLALSQGPSRTIRPAISLGIPLRAPRPSLQIHHRQLRPHALPLGLARPSSSAPLPPLLAASFLTDLSPVETLSHLLISFSDSLGAGPSIILLTLLLRSWITLPVTFWQRARIRRAALHVAPEMTAINKRLAVDVMRDCRKRGVDYEGYKKELKAQVSRGV